MNMQKRLGCICVMLPWLAIGFSLLFGAKVIAEVVINGQTRCITLWEYMRDHGFPGFFCLLFVIVQPLGIYLLLQKPGTPVTNATLRTRTWPKIVGWFLVLCGAGGALIGYRTAATSQLVATVVAAWIQG
jgi:hypothetical protein